MSRTEELSNGRITTTKTRREEAGWLGSSQNGSSTEDRPVRNTQLLSTNGEGEQSIMIRSVQDDFATRVRITSAEWIEY